MSSAPAHPQKSWLPQKPILVLGSRNRDKIAEYKALLEPIASDVINLDQLEERLRLPEKTLGNVPEPGVTYEQNACIKARAITEAIKKSGIPDQDHYVVLTDDSGVEISNITWKDVSPEDEGKNQNTLLMEGKNARLSGRAYPGVDTAYVEAGRTNESIHASYQNAIIANNSDRSMRPITVIAALTLYDGHVRYFRGEGRGKLSDHAAGTNGFGYDCSFIPNGYDKTYAQMFLTEKVAISERRTALNLLLNSLQGSGLAPGLKAGL